MVIGILRSLGFRPSSLDSYMSHERVLRVFLQGRGQAYTARARDETDDYMQGIVMKNIYQGILVAGVMLMGVSAVAHADVGVGIKGGTLGAGLEVTVGVTESINARLGFNQFTYNTNVKETDVEYSADLKLQNTTAILDWHPFQGTFRLSAGYVFNNNAIKMSGKPRGGSSFDINGTLYTLDGLDGDVSFANGAYLGLGWGNAGKGKGFGGSIDIGAIYQGSPDLRLTARGSSAIVNNPTFRADLAREQANTQDKMSSSKWYPVVTLGFSYTF